MVSRKDVLRHVKALHRIFKRTEVKALRRQQKAVDYLTLVLNGRPSQRADFGAVKDAILLVGRTSDSFDVDDLIATGELPSKSSRKSVVSCMHALCRRRILKIIEHGKRGRHGTPTRFAVRR